MTQEIKNLLKRNVGKLEYIDKFEANFKYKFSLSITTPLMERFHACKFYIKTFGQFNKTRESTYVLTINVQPVKLFARNLTLNA